MILFHVFGFDRLRNKSDGDRKMEIVKYAQQTRALLIRLLALVKWAGNSSSVQKCAVRQFLLIGAS